MSVIPLVTIFKLISFVLSGVAALKIREAWKRNPRDENLYYFYRYFIFVSVIFFSFVVLPFVKDLRIIQGFFYITNFAIFICAGYLYRIVLAFTYFKNIGDVVFRIGILLAFLTTIFGIFSFQPAIAMTYSFAGYTFVDWAINLPFWLVVFCAIIAIIANTVVTILFLSKGLRGEDQYIRIRSSLLGLGMFMLGVAAFIFYTAGTLTFLGIVRDLIHGIVSVLSAGFIVAGIFFKRKNHILNNNLSV